MFPLMFVAVATLAALADVLIANPTTGRRFVTVAAALGAAAIGGYAVLGWWPLAVLSLATWLAYLDLNQCRLVTLRVRRGKGTR